MNDGGAGHLLSTVDLQDCGFPAAGPISTTFPVPEASPGSCGHSPDVHAVPAIERKVESQFGKEALDVNGS